MAAHHDAHQRESTIELRNARMLGVTAQSMDLSLRESPYRSAILLPADSPLQ